MPLMKLLVSYSKRKHYPLIITRKDNRTDRRKKCSKPTRHLDMTLDKPNPTPL